MKQSAALLGIPGAALMAVFAFTAIAQDDPAGEGAVAEAEAPAVEIKPRAAELMPLTAQSLLLDVVSAGDKLVAVGDRGGIIISTDGANWTQAQVPVRAALTAVHFPDPNNGWAVGHDAAIVRTQDGGLTWTLQNFKPELEKPFLDVYFLDANRGFAVGAYGLLYATTDGGQTWTEPEAPAIREEELHFNAITRLGNGELFIAGESGMLAVSSDGEKWQRLSSPYDSSLFGALPVGDKGALIFGLRGNAYLSRDVRAGKWTRLETNSVASMFGGAALPGGELAMVGLNGVILIVNVSGDASGKVRGLQSSTGTPLSNAIARNGGLLAVGESGVQTIKLN